MKTFIASLSLVLALGLVACSDDDGGDKDSGVKEDTGTTQDDTGTTKQDTGTTQQDGSGPTGGNSGQTCDNSTPPCPTGDTCLGVAGWTKGMCVAPCAKQGDICPVTDASKYYSTCALANKEQTEWHCLYICELQGKTYECPDPATQDCVATAQAGIKMCKPSDGTTTPDQGVTTPDQGTTTPDQGTTTPDAGATPDA